MSKIAVEKIEIKIGANTISLTLEQAKELKDVLNQTFPDQKGWNHPIVIEKHVKEYPNKWWEPNITCYKDNTHGSLSYSLKPSEPGKVAF